MSLPAITFASKFYYMRWSRLIFICLFLVAATIAYRFGKQNSEKADAPSQVSESLPTYQSEHGHAVRQLLSVVETNNQKFSSMDEVDSILESMNPLNDWILSLNAAGRDKFLSNHDTSGIEIMDQIPELGFIRFSVTDSRKALPLLNEMMEKNNLSFNSTLRQPLSPRKEEILENLEFSDSFIEWMGGALNRKQLGKGIKVALLDSGVNQNHPMLAGVTVIEKDCLPKTSSESASINNAHGTAVASVIASSTESYSGVAPGCEILSYRVIDGTGKTDSYTVASAIVNAVQDGADLINLSLGGEQGSEVLKQAVSFAIANGDPLIAAVGNDGIGLVNSPAAYDGVIGVTSVGLSGRVSNFSNFGAGVDLAAPGTGVLVAWDSSEMANFSGTSISSAIVAGAVAMELSKFPSLSPTDVSNLIQKFSNDAEKPGFDSISGYGVLSLSRLENKNNPSYSDPALVGYHFEYDGNLKTGLVPFDVVVQNQGNNWLDNLTLKVDYLGINKSLRIDNLSPGEIRTEKCYLQGSDLGKPVKIEAKLHIPDGMMDYRKDNNSRSSVINF